MTAGILSVAGEELANRVYFLQNSEGGGLAPFDCWLCLRGLKTMSIRMERLERGMERLESSMRLLIDGQQAQAGRDRSSSVQARCVEGLRT